MAVDRLGPDKVGRTRRVLFDTSFLLSVMEHPTPWQDDILGALGGFEGVVLQPVYSELKRLSEGSARSSRFALLALGLVDRGAIRVEPSGPGGADDELVSSALGDGAAVATLDRDLIRMLLASHVDVVSLRRGRVEVRRS